MSGPRMSEPGWYPMPGDGRLRYFNGQTWRPYVPDALPDAASSRLRHPPQHSPPEPRSEVEHPLLAVTRVPSELVRMPRLGSSPVRRGSSSHRGSFGVLQLSPAGSRYVATPQRSNRSSRREMR